ncbi:hypothetical protein [Humisphaera borealis]|uniref:Uncharacterized protein n=1 Tax=Humisphaera borealis TaxID=2807512 RepID=A0A7M2WWB3_9BACT|nr:hypothetical protein [Humisphaera borealis]QOV89756.1 hypothetical protein IPV69_26835 [Humisphaera borealis]
MVYDPLPTCELNNASLVADLTSRHQEFVAIYNFLQDKRPIELVNAMEPAALGDFHQAFPQQSLLEVTKSRASSAYVLGAGGLYGLIGSHAKMNGWTFGRTILTMALRLGYKPTASVDDLKCAIGMFPGDSFEPLRIGDGWIDVKSPTPPWLEKEEVEVTASSSASPTYKFQKDGEVFVVAFDGAEAKLPSDVNLRRLHYLLGRPDQEIQWHELAAVDAEAPPLRVGFKTADINDLNPDGGTTPDFAMDGEYVAKVQTYIEEAERELEYCLDQEKRVGLADAISRAKTHLVGSTGLGGKIRDLGQGSTQSKAASVGRSLARGIKRLRERGLGALATHLEKNIDAPGETWKYAPESPAPEWEL